MVSAINGLMESGQVQKGSAGTLETVPIPFVQGATLVNGQWIDRFVLELAEWGASLQAAGYALQDPEECDPVDICRFCYFLVSP